MSTGRRPIATRSSGWVQALARTLSELGFGPNQISLGSLAAAALAALAFALTSRSPCRALYLAAAAGIQLRLLCNLLDGLVAVEGGRRTPSGEIFNELPDRYADILILMGAGLAAGGSGLYWGVAATLGALLTAYVRALATGAGAPADFCGPMAKQHRMAVLTGACLLAAVRPASGPGLLSLALMLIAAGTALTVSRRTLRAISSLEAAKP